MSGGTAYVLGLRDEPRQPRVARAGELELHPLGSADREILRDLLEQHLETPTPPVAARSSPTGDAAFDRFTKVLPRDYAAVLAAERRRRGADPEARRPEGSRPRRRRRLDAAILEVTGG